MLSKSYMPIGYFIIVLLLFLQTYDISCRKTIIRYVLSYPSSSWREFSHTPFGRKSCCSGFVEISVKAHKSASIVFLKQSYK